jgi:anthranilate phosphoribosyltransferase
MIQQALAKLVERRDLTREEMIAAMGEMTSGAATRAQVGAFLTTLRLKGETVDEIIGAAEFARARVEPIRVTVPVFVDTCGTGGDGQSTFNISTAAAFVVAAAGVPVAKHGNRSVSSKCGSADVLTALGVDVGVSTSVVEACIAELGIGFLHAARLHPAFKAVAEIRSELGVRTIFNLLGPLANPAGALHQALGVYDRRWVPQLGRVLQALGAVHAFVVHGDGLDEISVTGPTLVCEVRKGEVRDYEIVPEELGLRRWPLEDLVGGDVARNASILRDVLGGQAGAPRDIVLANAAAALVAGKASDDLKGGVRLAARAIDSGAAAAKLAALASRTAVHT